MCERGARAVLCGELAGEGVADGVASLGCERERERRGETERENERRRLKTEEGLREGHGDTQKKRTMVGPRHVG